MKRSRPTTSRRAPRPKSVPPKRAHTPHRRIPVAIWLHNHLRALMFSLGKLWRTPAASSMTIAVIGIALALPTGFYVLLQNMQGLVNGLDRGVQITLYLKKSVNNQQLRALSKTLSQWPGVDKTKAITPAQGLAEFRRYSGFGNTLDALGGNPLPPVIVIYPRWTKQGTDALQALSERLKKLPQVEVIRMDMAWVQRLLAIIDIAQRAAWIVGGMLALAVLLVVGNTIRLDILGRRQEIEVAKLIGATDAFIRRPFLYGGLWLGLLGGMTALILVGIAIFLMGGPVKHLASLYGSPFKLHGLNAVTNIRFLAFSALLGLAGAWLAVGRHLRDIEPG